MSAPRGAPPRWTCIAPASPSRRRGRGARRERRAARTEACAGESAPRRILSLTHRPEARREVAQHRWFGGHLQAAHRARVDDDLGSRVSRLLQLARAVDPPRNGEAHELEWRYAILPTRGIAARHDRADLDAAHAAREVERAGERLGGELGRWDLRQHPARVEVDGVPTDRPDDRGALLLENRTEVGDLLDAVAEVVLAEHLPEADRDRLEIPPGEAAVGWEPFEDDPARLQPLEEDLVLADGDEAADVRDRVLLRAHEDAVRVEEHLAGNVRKRLVRIPFLALADEPGVLGEARDVEHELLRVLPREPGDLVDVGHGDRLAAARVVRQCQHHDRDALAVLAGEELP